MKKVIRDLLLLVIVAGIIDVVDQYTKTLIRQAIPLEAYWSPWPWLAPIAGFRHINNTGVAFGMFQGAGANTFFAILAMIVSVAIIFYFPRVPSNQRVVRLALMMMLGGAVGNLIDRVTQGYVTDFISVGSFAIFNVADASITVGVGVLLLGVWLEERHRKVAEKAAKDEPDRPLEPGETHDQTGTGN